MMPSHFAAGARAQRRTVRATTVGGFRSVSSVVAALVLPGAGGETFRPQDHGAKYAAYEHEQVGTCG
jgi:hypothetical protein